MPQSMRTGCDTPLGRCPRQGPAGPRTELSGISTLDGGLVFCRDVDRCRLRQWMMEPCQYTWGGRGRRGWSFGLEGLLGGVLGGAG